MLITKNALATPFNSSSQRRTRPTIQFFAAKDAMAETTTASGTAKPLEYMVLDAGALIRGHGLNLYQKAKKVVTVPDVIAELRDSKSRDLLARLPFEIEERTPSQSSINAGA